MTKPLISAEKLSRQVARQQKNIGLRVGKLIVTDVFWKNGSIFYNCICDCKKECIKPYNSIQSGKLRDKLSCGCDIYQYNKGNKNYLWSGFGEISSRFWHSCKANAKIRSLKFKISIEKAWELFLSQNRRCALTGEFLEFPKDSFSVGTASLDRIDNNYGYTIGNVWWVHKTLNEMKWDMSLSDFETYTDLIVSPIKSSVPSIDCFVFVKHHKNWDGFGNISLDFWSRNLHSAKKRNFLFDITIDYAWNLFLDQKGRCALTGLPLSLNEKKCSASLDRINNSKGYVAGNVQWVHKDINIMKNVLWFNQTINYHINNAF